jgi:uncharacterized membrane protein YqjE
MIDFLRQRLVADDSIPTLLSRAISEAQVVARSEIDLQKAKLGAKVDQAKGGVVLLVSAMLFGSLGLIALVVGVLMILAPLLGPIAATAIVAGTLLVLAAVCGLLASQHFKRMFAPAETQA